MGGLGFYQDVKPILQNGSALDGLDFHVHIDVLHGYNLSRLSSQRLLETTRGSGHKPHSFHLFAYVSGSSFPFPPTSLTSDLERKKCRLRMISFLKNTQREIPSADG